MRIARNELARLLAAIIKVVEARNTIPILSAVRLQTKDGALTATATDLDVSATASAPADGEFAGCLDAKMLSEIVRKLPADAEVDIADEDGTAVIKAGRSRFKLPVLPVSDFPEIEHGAYDAEFDVDLAALFAPIKFAISSDATRFYLNGIYLHVIDGLLTAVATDGHRLGRNVGQSAPEFTGVIVPRKMCGLVPDGIVSVAISKTKIRVVKDGTVFVSKLIDATFPDYRRVVPANNEFLLRVDKAALAAAADRVAVVSDVRGSAVRLTIADGAIALSARGASEEANDSVPCEWGGDEFVIGFNSRYLVDALAQFPAGEVTIALQDAGSPALIMGGAEGIDVTLMPMRV